MSRKHKHTQHGKSVKPVQRESDPGIAIAFEIFCDSKEKYEALASMYQDWSAHVTKKQIKESGATRRVLAKHYRYLANCALAKVRLFDSKANRLLSQL